MQKHFHIQPELSIRRPAHDDNQTFVGGMNWWKVVSSVCLVYHISEVPIPSHAMQGRIQGEI